METALDNVIEVEVTPLEQESWTATDVPVWRMSVMEYRERIQSSKFTREDRVELLKGMVSGKMTKNQGHVVGSGKLFNVFRVALPLGWWLSSENPMYTSDSVPEPDAAIVRGEPDDYIDRVISPPDIGLVIEVSDTTLRTDQRIKQWIYAGAGIPQYWIVNLVDRLIEVYAEPLLIETGAYYARRTLYQGKAEIPLNLDGQIVAQVSARSLLPKK